MKIENETLTYWQLNKRLVLAARGGILNELDMIGCIISKPPKYLPFAIIGKYKGRRLSIVAGVLVAKFCIDRCTFIGKRRGRVAAFQFESNLSIPGNIEVKNLVIKPNLEPELK